MKKQLILLFFAAVLFAENKTMKLYESPYCGCCELWGKYMQNKGYTLEIHKITELAALKDKFGIKNEYQSCHTGVIQDYIIEGHVPESAVSWLLENKPNNVLFSKSCHTGVIQDYIIEGHVPESAVSWLLENKPNNVLGIATPAMPQGSPGMEQGYEEEYPVILLNKDGSYTIYGYFKGEKLVRKPF